MLLGCAELIDAEQTYTSDISIFYACYKEHAYYMFTIS